MDIDDELKLYVAKCNDSTIYTPDNRHIASLDTSLPTSASVAINTKYNTTDNTSETQLTLYTSSIEDVSETHCASYCDWVDNDYTGRDGEIARYTYTAGAPFFLKSNRTLYIKGGSWDTQIQSFTYQANNLNLYEIYGDNEVLTCYGGEYWYSDFSVIDDNTGYAGYAECPYEYCAAKFYSTYDDSITNEARTCPACSNTIYFSSQYSDDLQCNASAPAPKYWYGRDTFDAAEDISDYRSSCSCPYDCGTEFYLSFGVEVANELRICPTCSNNIYFFCDDLESNFYCTKDSSGIQLTGEYMLGYYIDGSVPVSNKQSSDDYMYERECPYTDCDARFYWYYNPLSNYSDITQGTFTCPECKNTVIVTTDDELIIGGSTVATQYYFDDADLQWYTYTDSYAYSYDNCPGCNRRLYMNTSIPTTDTTCPYTDCQASIRISGYTISTPSEPSPGDPTFTAMSENTSYYVAYTSDDWSYYKFEAPVEGYYYVKSNSLEGDMDCYIFMSKDSCLSGDTSDSIYGDGNTGDFNYEVYLNSGEIIYMKVRQYRDVSDGYFSISRDSSVTPPPVSGPYICSSCNTEYSTESERDKCRTQDGCPYFLLCPNCGTYTGYVEAIYCESCSGGSVDPNPPSGEEGTYCDNHGGYYYGDYCDTCYDRCEYCDQTYSKGYTHYCGCPVCGYSEYMQDGGYCYVCNYPDYSYNSCGCVATTNDYYDGESGHKICGTCGSYADM